MAALMNFTLVEVSPGRALFRGLPGERHLNPLGGVHGGWAATIMDSALGCAVQTLLGKGEAYATAEFKVNLVRPITPQTGEVVCEGRIVHKGLAGSLRSLAQGRFRQIAGLRHGDMLNLSGALTGETPSRPREGEGMDRAR